jgi:hypothetical protein
MQEEQPSSEQSSEKRHIVADAGAVQRDGRTHVHASLFGGAPGGFAMGQARWPVAGGLGWEGPLPFAERERAVSVSAEQDR